VRALWLRQSGHRGSRQALGIRDKWLVTLSQISPLTYSHVWQRLEIHSTCSIQRPWTWDSPLAGTHHPLHHLQVLHQKSATVLETSATNASGSCQTAAAMPTALGTRNLKDYTGHCHQESFIASYNGLGWKEP